MKQIFAKYRFFPVSMLIGFLVLSACLVLRGGPALAAAAHTGISGRAAAGLPGRDPGRQVLPENDGWASADGGTTGGANAAADHVYVVTNRAQLVQALGGDNTGADATPKIIYIQGTINANEDDQGNPLTCDDYATEGYSLAAYLQTYDPAIWGRTQKPSGPLETARHDSETNQAKRVQIFIPSNTTIIGISPDARVLGANFMISNVSNVIIRNIRFENAFDCFPQWDPTDGSTGNWNSAFDNISILNNATHVWIDHNTFTDGSLLDSQEPLYFGREFEQHDGELDITKGADLVTVSWNRFTNHDKTMLIGSTDSPTYDVGKLRVTIHHNDFENTIQRLPRVRYGQVHVYNNFYNEAQNAAFLYALGVGVKSQIFAQNNFYLVPSGFAAGNIIGYYKGTAIHTEGDIVNGEPTDLLAAYNALNTPTLGSDVGWTPQFHLRIDPTFAVPPLVLLFAGSDHLLI
jgi:pectate lyase